MAILKKVFFVLLLVLLLAGKPVYAVAIQSVDSGIWTDPNTWNPQQEPNVSDDVTINAGHTVAVAPSAAGTRNTNVVIRIRSLTIQQGAALITHGPEDEGAWIIPAGGLPPQRTTGWPIYIYVVQSLTNNGEIRGENEHYSNPVDAHRAKGGDIFFIPDSTGVNPTFTNDGLIRGGKGVSGAGGNIFMTGPAWDDQFTWGNVTNNGQILGGEGWGDPSCHGTMGGFIRFTGVDTINTGLIRGGDATGDSASSGGFVTVHGTNSVTNDVGGVIRGGDCHLPSDNECATGGWVQLWAVRTSLAGAGVSGPVVNEAGAQIISGDGYMGGMIQIRGRTKRIEGEVRAGTSHNPNCDDPFVLIDPNEGEITGDANVTGGNIEIAAEELLTIGDLNHPNAICAEWDIIITVAPGGTLDMRNNSSGTNWIYAVNNVTINADTIYTDDSNGVALSEIIYAGGSIIQNDGAYPSPTTDQDNVINLVMMGRMSLPMGATGYDSNSVDDFDSYTDTAALRSAWDITGGAGAGRQRSLEPNTVHDGNSMKFDFNNESGSYYSEVFRTFSPSQDWTANNMRALSMWVRGDPNVSRLYVTLVDANDVNATVYISDPNLVMDTGWYNWDGDVDLDDYAGFQMCMAAIKKIIIGVGDGSPGGQGTIYIDDITQYPSRCFGGKLEGDINGDCELDFKDFGEFADNWLQDGLWP